MFGVQEHTVLVIRIYFWSDGSEHSPSLALANHVHFTGTRSNHLTEDFSSRMRRSFLYKIGGVYKKQPVGERQERERVDGRLRCTLINACIMMAVVDYQYCLLFIFHWRGKVSTAIQWSATLQFCYGCLEGSSRACPLFCDVNVLCLSFLLLLLLQFVCFTLVSILAGKCPSVKKNIQNVFTGTRATSYLLVAVACEPGL